MTTTFPFHAVKLTFQGGETIIAPIGDANALHLKKGAASLTKKFAKRFQEKILGQGQYENILGAIKQGDFTKMKVLIDFPAATDGFSYPAIELGFDCFFQTVKHGVWGVLPALGLECMAEDEASFPQRMAEVVRVEFTSKKRLALVQSILTSLWFEAAEMEQSEMELEFYTPSELANLQQDKEQGLLAKVATKLEVAAPEAYGREEEVSYMGRILSGRFSKNILLVGASGSGKTAVVREVAHRRRKAKAEQKIWETSASRMIKELTKETGWQDNLSLLVNELTRQGDFLFIKNLAELFEVGRYEGNNVSMAEYLRSSLSRGELTIITECTPEERARIELSSPGYLSFFQVIEIQPPKTGLSDIIRKKVLEIAGKRKVKFEAGAIEEVIRLHERFMPYSGMPGKPIRFLESVLLSKTVQVKSKEVKSKKAKGEKVKSKKLSEAKSRTDISSAKEIQDGYFSLEPPITNHQSLITRETVLHYFSQDSGMPLFLIDPARPMDVDAIQQDFNQNVFGQERAVDAVTGLLASVKTALTRTGKPIASFLFVGPTGVGKTELAKVLANFTFGSRERMVRFDMSEYSNPWSVMRLTGQGFHSDGLLTSAVRREPFCVLLFDEIEKADPSFFDLLLQILGEGRLSDSRGQLVNFCSTIIVMTSNIGAGNLLQNRIGWKKELNTDDVTSHFTREVEKHFKPELFNRIDSVVAFEPLSKETVRYVVEREIQLFKKREGIQFRRVDLQIEEAVLDQLAARGYDPKYGARYLQRTLRELLIVPLARQLNQYEHDDRLTVNVVMENDEFVVRTEADPLAFDLLMEQWDKLTLAEEASRLRRKMMRMLEGPIFMRMQSELDMLEADKERLKDRFWENVATGGQYTHFLSVKEMSEKLYQRIQDLEMEMALTSMEQADFRTDFPERLEQWTKDLRAWQLLVHGLLFPAENTCLMAIYGSQPEQVIRFYAQLFSEKEIVVREARAIWYEERLLGGKSGFMKKKIPAENLLTYEFEAENKAAILYGLELELEGDAVQKYLVWELGVQRWEGKERGSWNLFHLTFFADEIETPPNIHRQSFYKSPKPHRTWAEREFSDQRLGIHAQVKPDERLALVLAELDRRLELVLEQFFLGGDEG